MRKLTIERFSLVNPLSTESMTYDACMTLRQYMYHRTPVSRLLSPCHFSIAPLHLLKAADIFTNSNFDWWRLIPTSKQNSCVGCLHQTCPSPKCLNMSIICMIILWLASRVIDDDHDKDDVLISIWPCMTWQFVCCALLWLILLMHAMVQHVHHGLRGVSGRSMCNHMKHTREPTTVCNSA